MGIPSFKINDRALRNFLSFVYQYDQLLKEFGAIKIQPTNECKLALKKRRKNIASCPTGKQAVKINQDSSIYSIEKISQLGVSIARNLPVKDECGFWSSLRCLNDGQQPLNISTLLNNSFFSKKTARIYFDIHRLPHQSMLKLGGSKVTRRFVPCVQRAHGSGAIFPLASAQQRLFSFEYHHEGGARHWYIIPACERDHLRRVIDQHDASLCLDHGQLFLDPSVLEKNRIRYHQVVQYPNEFLVIAAGALAQSFTEDAMWSESVPFALPSWIEDGHGSLPSSSCQCSRSHDTSVEKVDVALFRDELIQKYIATHLEATAYHESTALKGSTPLLTPSVSLERKDLDNRETEAIAIPTLNYSESNSLNSTYYLICLGFFDTRQWCSITHLFLRLYRIRRFRGRSLHNETWTHYHQRWFMGLSSPSIKRTHSNRESPRPKLLAGVSLLKKRLFRI